MAVKTIRTVGDPVLRLKAQDVSAISEEIVAVLADMVETMEHYNGVGLAAPQIGRSLAIVVIRPSEDLPVFEFVNPVITSCSGQDIDIEGCLSVPGTFGRVSRCSEIELEYQDRQGRRKRLKAAGLFARIIQHELDHLAGVLFVDKAESILPEEAES